MFVLATVDSGLYKLFLFLHIVSVIVAFAPAVIHPLMGNQLSSDPGARSAFIRYAHQNAQRIYGTALIAAGLFGILMIVVSDDVIEFSDGWVSASFLIWIAMLGVLHGLILPAEKKLMEGDAAAEQRLQMAGMGITVLLLIMLYLMIWRPGA